jgi:antitoxin PrlF
VLRTKIQSSEAALERSLKERRIRIDANGRVVIPVSIRRALGIKSRDTVVLRVENNELLITTLGQRLAKAQRMVSKYAGSTTSLVDELIAERREGVRRAWNRDPRQ